MELKEVLTWITNPDKLIDPRVVDQLLFEVSGYIGHYEEQLGEQDQQLAQKQLALIEIHGTVAKAQANLKVEQIYRDTKTTERMIRQLKAFRSNLTRRYKILTNNFN